MTEIEETREYLVCKRCGYKWFPNVKNPVRCAKCNSPFWNMDRVRSSKRKIYVWGVASKHLSLSIELPPKWPQEFATVSAINGFYRETFELSPDEFQQIVDGLPQEQIANHPIGKCFLDYKGEGVALANEKEAEEYFISIGKAIQGQMPQTPEQILSHLTRVKVYGITGMDVFFGDTPFRLRKEDFKSPKNFQIWAMMEKQWVTNLTEGEWQQLITQFSASYNAVSEDMDPLAPPVLEKLLNMLESSPPYDDFCEAVADSLDIGGSTGPFVVKDNLVYFPTSIMQQLRKELRISLREIRQLLEPYLAFQDSQVHYVQTKKVARGFKSYRFWVLTFPKLIAVKPALADIELLKCEDEEAGF